MPFMWLAVTFNIYSVALLIGSFQGMVFGTLSLIRGIRQNRLSDRLFSLLLFLMILLISPYTLGFMGINIMWDELLFFPYDPGLLIGPVLYFYLVSKTNEDFGFRLGHIRHLIPFGVYFFYHLAVFFKGKAFVQYWISNIDLPFVYPFFQLATLVSNYVYLFMAIRHYHRYRDWIETAYSNTHEIRLDWYRNYLYLLSFGITLAWVFNALNSFGVNLSFTQNWWEYFFLAVLLYIIGQQGYFQPRTIYLHYEPKEKTGNGAELPSGELELWKERIGLAMEKDKVYLNPELTVREVASKLNTSASLVSNVINTGFGKNFNQYVNDFRVEAFKEAVANPENDRFNLLSIALDCGFNSKATFNRVFKNATGLSPKDFIDQSQER